jgi:hypothetical protein
MYKLFRFPVVTIPTAIAMVLITILLAGTLTTTIAAHASSTSNLNNTTVAIPIAESVYQSESMKLPPSVGSFIILIANEAHENWQDEKHKLITDKNSYYIPKNLVVPQGTALSFLNADAPWDTPHPQTIEIINDGGETVYTTGVLEYTNSSEPAVLPVGNYTIVNTEYEATEGTISVTNQKSNGNLVVGGFYTPSHQVENNRDNDGGVHPGSLDYYRAEFPKNGFTYYSTEEYGYQPQVVIGSSRYSNEDSILYPLSLSSPLPLPIFYL